MLYSTLTPAAKRRALRERLGSGDLLELPGAFSPLAARLVQDKGFDGVYVSGAVVAADLGLPDVGLTTLTEVATRAGQIARMTDLPTLVDADTGFGEAMNVARTVQTLEDAGVAGLHVEDQVNPKRCGHLDGKQVVDDAVAVQRVRAAVDARRDPDLLIMARTDARGVLGLDAALDRARALVDAGADALFPEALQGLGEYERFAALGVPVLANMTEFGKTELYPRDRLRDAGVAVVIYPVSLLRVAMGAAERALDALRAEGSLASQVPTMQTRARLYELLDYAGYTAFDDDVYDFRAKEHR
jgi:methylisocitrate lyase